MDMYGQKRNGIKFHWHIQNYAHLKDNVLVSDSFWSYSALWEIILHPRGINGVCDFMSIELKLLHFPTEQKSITFNCSFALIDSKKEPLIFKDKRHCNISIDDFDISNQVITFNDFISNFEIFGSKRNTFLPGRELEVQCCIWKSWEDLKLAEKLNISRTIIEDDSEVIEKSFVWYLEQVSSLEQNVHQMQVEQLKSNGESLTIKVFWNEDSEMEAIITLSSCKWFVKCKISLLDAWEEEVQFTESMHHFKNHEEEWRFKPNILKSMLISHHNLLLRDDMVTLRFRCTLSDNFSFTPTELISKNLKCLFESFVRPSDISKAAMSTDEPESEKADHFNSISQDLVGMYEEGFMSDFSLRSGDKTFPVHKAVLGARSPVFRAMFTDKVKEKVVTDMDVDTLQRMLRFIYSDRVEEDMEWELASKLLSAADRYALESLKQICSTILKSGLSTSNALDILLLAEEYQDKDLKCGALDFISWNDKHIIGTECWSKFEAENAQLALDTCRELYLKKMNTSIEPPDDLTANPATGGTAIKFIPMTGTDVTIKKGRLTNINVNHQCITCMKEYEDKSLEELRIEHYTANCKQNAGSVGIGFGATSQQPSIFSSAASASTSDFPFKRTSQKEPMFNTTGIKNTFGSGSFAGGFFGKPPYTATAAPHLNASTGAFSFGQNFQQKEWRRNDTTNCMSKGQAATSVGFGATVKQPHLLLAPAASSTSGFSFGSTMQPRPLFSTTATNIFGSGGGPFGQFTQNQNAEGLFGKFMGPTPASKLKASTETSLFGQKLRKEGSIADRVADADSVGIGFGTAAKQPFGFGTPAVTTSMFSFGNTIQSKPMFSYTDTFGSSGGLFGQSAQKQNAGSFFGNPASLGAFTTSTAAYASNPGTTTRTSPFSKDNQQKAKSGEENATSKENADTSVGFVSTAKVPRLSDAAATTSTSVFSKPMFSTTDTTNTVGSGVGSFGQTTPNKSVGGIFGQSAGFDTSTATASNGYVDFEASTEFSVFGKDAQQKQSSGGDNTAKSNVASDASVIFGATATLGATKDTSPASVSGTLHSKPVFGSTTGTTGSDVGSFGQLAEDQKSEGSLGESADIGVASSAVSHDLDTAST